MMRRLLSWLSRRLPWGEYEWTVTAEPYDGDADEGKDDP